MDDLPIGRLLSKSHSLCSIPGSIRLVSIILRTIDSTKYHCIGDELENPANPVLFRVEYRSNFGHLIDCFITDGTRFWRIGYIHPHEFLFTPLYAGEFPSQQQVQEAIKAFADASHTDQPQAAI